MDIKNAEFCIDFKNVNLVMGQNAPKKSYSKKTLVFFCEKLIKSQLDI
jgi:hypothetical protein